MYRYLDRLRRGERWWAAELALRIAGLALLGGCYRLGLLSHRLSTAQPSHVATLGEFAICAATFVSLTCGLALTFEGPGLFRFVPVPTHSAYFPRD